MLLQTAIILGFAGSLHCLGMCAPLLWAAPESPTSKTKWLSNKLAYNFGRAITYTALGAVFGLIGKSLNLIGLQQYLSIGAGVLILLLLLFSGGHIPSNFQVPFIQKVVAKVRSGLGKHLGKNSFRSHLSFGLLNGLLPCGLVYMGLFASVSMGSIEGGALYMFLFGLGTFPMMLGAAFFGSRAKKMKTNWTKTLIPKMIVLVSLLLILRGLNLGIPYVSPALNDSNDVTLCVTPE